MSAGAALSLIYRVGLPGESQQKKKSIFFPVSFVNLIQRLFLVKKFLLLHHLGRGIFPDVMHITHLALAPDVITSCLLDWSDDAYYFAGTTRDRRLHVMWESYRLWCESQMYPLAERAQKKLFTTSVLKPDAGRYVELSQKVLNATAARYMLFWIASLAKQFAEWTQEDPDM